MNIMNQKTQLKSYEEQSELGHKNTIHHYSMYNNSDILEKIPPSPSVLLRNAREKSGMSVKATAKQLFLETSMIRVLESDKYDKIPDVFVRGYLRNYAKLQEIPQEDIMESFDTMVAQQPTLSPLKPKIKPYVIPYLENRINFDIIFIIGMFVLVLLSLLLIWQISPMMNNDYRSFEKNWSSSNVTNQTVGNFVRSDIIIPTTTKTIPQINTSIVTPTKIPIIANILVAE
ncbi:helix-turn-helix domain-containing protein [Candidatus Halobeggiatoa sp. HSG11]|nr:helix-turn-helix domain-containing protein [Candidatus Halobeggiatoa sp. HSG11]